jgi:hypothetical protein
MILFLYMYLIYAYMESKEFCQFILEFTKGNVCMYDIFGTCDKANCSKKHLTDIKQKNFMKTLVNNVFDSSIIKKLPFYVDNDKYINNNQQMKEYIKKKGITNKADMKYEISDRLKRDILKIGNKIGKFENPKTCLSVCSRHLFMPFCNNYKSGNHIAIEVRYPDETVTSINLCYSHKHYLSFCNCDVEISKSTKTGRFYVKDIFKINKSNKPNLSNYMRGHSEEFKHRPYEIEPRKQKLDKTFKMEQKSFPTMTDEEPQVPKPQKWVTEKAVSPVSSLKLDDAIKGPQREISSSSLSEMSSPVKLDIKEFDSLITMDLNEIESRDEFIKIIEELKIEYDKARGVAINYYEKYQNSVIMKDSNEMSYRTTVCDLKKKLEKQHQEQMSYLEEYSDISDISDTDSNDSLKVDDF